MLPADTFTGQVVVVTVGGTGLGKAMALEFARLGAAVAIASRDRKHRDTGVRAVEEVGARATGVAPDARDPDAVARIFDESRRPRPRRRTHQQRRGQLSNPGRQAFAERLAQRRRHRAHGTFHCSTEFARRTIARGTSGAILDIGATYSWAGGPGTAHSAAAKAGVTNLTQTLPVEWAPHGIRVNCLAPGRFPHDDLPPLLVARRDDDADASRIPAGRVGQPHELGWAATYMCSPYASYLSGHTLLLDGANWLRRRLTMAEFTPVSQQFP